MKEEFVRLSIAYNVACKRPRIQNSGLPGKRTESAARIVQNIDKIFINTGLIQDNDLVTEFYFLVLHWNASDTCALDPDFTPSLSTDSIHARVRLPG